MVTTFIQWSTSIDATFPIWTFGLGSRFQNKHMHWKWHAQPYWTSENLQPYLTHRSNLKLLRLWFTAYLSCQKTQSNLNTTWRLPPSCIPKIWCDFSTISPFSWNLVEFVWFWLATHIYYRKSDRNPIWPLIPYWILENICCPCIHDQIDHSHQSWWKCYKLE